MKIFDCFIYYNEDLIVDIRLNTLFKYVEKFIIIESRYDHQGNKKKLNFKINNFKKFKDKIIYLIVEKFPKNLSNWERENFQRNYIVNGLSHVDKDDYVIISDADEIPDLTKIVNLDNHKFTVFEQKMYYYKINLRNKTEKFWYGSKICKKKYLKSPQWLRKQKIKKYPFWAFYKRKWNIIKNGGWHFSFLMNPDQIKKKLNSYAHSEYNKNKYKNLKKIKNSIKNKIDLFDRAVVYEKNDLNNTFPNYIVNNKKKFSNWIL